MNATKQITEISITLISEKVRIEGKLIVEQVTRLHGTVIGEIQSLPGSTLIVCNTALVEGNVEADTVIVDGEVRGDVTAKNRVVITESGRVTGNIKTASLRVDAGGQIEGQSIHVEKS